MPIGRIVRKPAVTRDPPGRGRASSVMRDAAVGGRRRQHPPRERHVLGHEAGEVVAAAGRAVGPSPRRAAPRPGRRAPACRGRPPPRPRARRGRRRPAVRPVRAPDRRRRGGSATASRAASAPGPTGRPAGPGRGRVSPSAPSADALAARAAASSASPVGTPTTGRLERVGEPLDRGDPDPQPGERPGPGPHDQPAEVAPVDALLARGAPRSGRAAPRHGDSRPPTSASRSARPPACPGRSRPSSWPCPRRGAGRRRSRRPPGGHAAASR